ncbi:MAG: flagellar biosynthesis protein FlhB [Gammaproteobacteria bacterium]|nr:flagellar biosynthesis protein FlhB [Gammaproteobacteria bacterium]
MAEQDKAQERTEQATPKRLQEARKKGQIPRSRELNTLVLLLTSAVGFFFLGDGIVQGLGGLMQKGLQISRADIFNVHAPAMLFGQATLGALWVLMPLLALLSLAAMIAPVALGGWSFSTSSMKFRFSRVSPAAGLKRMFGSHGAMELFKALVKFALIGTALIMMLWTNAGDLLHLGVETPGAALVQAGSILVWSFLLISLPLIVVVIADVPFQLWQHAKQLRMTRQEVRDELKETDGSPEVKGRIRKLQRDMAERRMMAEVPKADVIITNPTHYSVALRYDQSRMRAPRLVAKGRDLIAAEIRRVAAEAGVTCVQAPSLARAVYHGVELNQEVPAALYKAVAQVLAYVYQLKTARQEHGVEPQLPDFSIPEEWRRD